MAWSLGLFIDSRTPVVKNSLSVVDLDIIAETLPSHTAARQTGKRRNFALTQTSLLKLNVITPVIVLV